MLHAPVEQLAGIGGAGACPGALLDASFQIVQREFRHAVVAYHLRMTVGRGAAFDACALEHPARAGDQLGVAPEDLEPAAGSSASFTRPSSVKAPIVKQHTKAQTA